MLNVTNKAYMLSVVILNVIMRSVMAPREEVADSGKHSSLLS